jgi:TPP-dependent pyruvate/acetoin dehydrogenase alpha subunit
MTTVFAATEQPVRLPDSELSRMLLIRHFELALLKLFAAGQIAGTTHTCLGQEYIPVSLAPLIEPAFVISNHRSHGHYLARFDDPAGLLAEITGRDGAVCGGMGGSQHLYRDGFCSTGVQGEGVAIALGVALHLKTFSPGRVAVAYIGDGTWGEGLVYESLNVARLWPVPMIVVVENNGIAQTTPSHRAMAGSVASRAAAFDVTYQRVESRCPVRIRQQLSGPVQAVRDRGEPLVVEFETDRLGPHSKGDDTRTETELAAVRARDWAASYARRYPEQYAAADAAQDRRVAALVKDVLARPLSTGRS